MAISDPTRLATLQTRLTDIQSAITASLQGNAQSYSTEIQSLTRFKLSALRDMERDTLIEINRLERGKTFGSVRFTRRDS